MGVNAALAIVKLAAGIFGHSYALIADAVESLADVFSSIVVWRGIVLAAEPADADHPYGHGKAEPIATAIVAGILLVAALGISAEAVRNIILPAEPPHAYTLAVLGIVIAIKEGLYRFVSREGSEIESAVVQGDAWHHRSDAITSLAAAIGISVALLGGPKYQRADSIAAIIAAIVIAWNGMRLLRGALLELMDTAPSRTLNADIRKFALEVPGVDDVEKCFVRKMGIHFFVDLHLEVDPQMTVQTAHDIAHQVKDRIRDKLPAVRDVLVHVEPSGRHFDS
jgi:cation diffusion facilitator family transporter